MEEDEDAEGGVALAEEIGEVGDVGGEEDEVGGVVMIEGRRSGRRRRVMRMR